MRINKETKRNILERDKYKCQICGRKLDIETAHLEHIIPLSKGGTNELSNLQVVCPLCNMLKADKIIDIASTPLSKQLAQIWIFAFRSSPRLTALLSIFIAVLTFGLGIYFSHIEKLKQETERKENLSYYAQIEQLNKFEFNIKQLLEFIKEQRTQLKATEDALLSLKSERERLKPLVESDRKVVEAFFIAQKQRAQASISRERWIGFALGLLASVIASTVMLIIKYFITKKRNA